MSTLVVSAILGCLPVEYAVDCTGWVGDRPATVTYRYVCRDGRSLSSEVVLGRRSNARLAVDAFTSDLEFNRWQFQKVGKSGDETVFIIRGSKSSPIESVTFKGDAWTPTVQRRIAIPPAAGLKK